MFAQTFPECSMNVTVPTGMLSGVVAPGVSQTEALRIQTYKHIDFEIRSLSVVPLCTHSFIHS